MKTEKIFLKIALCVIFWLLAAVSAHAGTGHGLTADSSLGTQVDKVEQIHNITGGATAGNNLFHSFSDFNVETGETANFIGNQSLANIISRVTGGNDSRIDGLLKTTDTSANLYLLNPNGVMFGPNAALDIQGSFHVTTADYLKFEDGRELHADLGNKSLLSAAPVEAFGFLGDSAGSITLNGTRLEVSEGKTLSLIGRLATETKSITNADLKAPGGCVNLASVKSDGEVKLTETGIEVTSEQLGNIELEHSSINVSNTANSSSVGQVFVQANDVVLKGSIIVDNYSEQDAAEPSIKIETNNLTVKDGSVISASTYGQGNSGDVLLNAAGSVIFTGESTGQYDGNTRIRVMALDKSTGDAGKLIINSNNILFSNGAQINTTTYGSGRGGDLLLNAKENVEFSGDGNGFIKAASCSTGDAGNIEINADNILFADGVELDSATYDKGKGGAVNLNANEKVSVDGRDGRNGRRTKLQVSTGGTGDAGSLVINAKKIEVSNSAHIDSSTTYKREGGGKGGTVELNAVNIEFNNGAWLYSESTAQGQGGTLILNAANNLTLKDGSLISADTVGQGNSGDVSLNAGNNLTLTNGSVISASTVGQGNSGDLSLNAGNNLTLTDGSFILAVTGVGNSGDVLLYAAESVIFEHYDGDTSIITGEYESTGDAGKVIINANNILLSNGSYMNTTTYGSGRGGDLLLNAKENVEFSGDGHGFIKAASCSTGDAGNIEINADNILFADGVELDSATYDKGKGGTVNLNANEKVSVDGWDGRNGRCTRFQMRTGDTGDAGSLVINAKKIEVSNSAYIDSSTTYEREGGGKGGTVELNAVNIEFNNGAWLYSETTCQGQGGTLMLNADERVLFCDSVIQATSEYAGEGAGDGGSVLIKAANIELADGALINAGTSGQGNAGKIMLAASKVISLNEKGHWSGEEFSTIASGTDADSTGGQGGYIGLNAPEIILTNGAGISAGTEYTGEVTFDGDEGCGGTIGIIAESLILQDESEITASSSGTGAGGSVLIGDYALIESRNEQHKTAEDPTGPFGDFLDAVQENGITETKNILADNSGIALSTKGSGNAGALKIKADNIEFTGGAYIDSTTHGSGQGGKVVIDVAETMSLSGENSAQNGSNIEVASGCSRKDAEDKGYDLGDFTGDAGSLYISAKNIEVTDGAWLNSSTYGDGKGGNVTLDIAENVLFQGQRSNKEGSKVQIATYNGTGNAGTLEIKAKEIRFRDSGYINSATDEGTGNAGKIMLVADELISLDGLGYNYYDGDKPVATFSSSVYAKSRGGRGGYIGLNAPEIILTNGASISAGTEYRGEVTPDGHEGCGGTIGIIADSLILRNGSEITGTTSGTGAGGGVLIGDYALIESCNEQHKTAEDPTGPFGDFLDRIQENGVTRTQNLLLANGSTISANSTSDAENAGESGDLIIRATDSIDLNYNSNFKTESKNAGGGSINIQTKNRLWLLNSWITTSTESTDENEKGGNITIDPTFVILQNVNPCTVGINNSRIEANANFGAGGNISIVTDYLIQSPDSTIEASSNKSVDGDVNIQSLDFDVSGVLANLNVNLLDAGKWQKTPCRLRSGASVSRLILKGRDAVPTAHDDFLSGLPAILSDPDFFAEDDNPYREGYVSPDVFEKGEEEKREEEKREEQECYNYVVG